MSREFLTSVVNGTGPYRGRQNEGSGAHKRCRVSETESGESAPWQFGRSVIGDSR
jgi:hypothetical protein